LSQVGVIIPVVPIGIGGAVYEVRATEVDEHRLGTRGNRSEKQGGGAEREELREALSDRRSREVARGDGAEDAGGTHIHGM